MVDSPPLALLSSFDHPCSLPHSPSTLMGLMGEKTRSGLRRERQKYPIHVVRFPPQGHSYPSPPSPLLKIPSQVTGGKKTFLVFARYQERLLQQHFSMHCQWYSSNQDWGQHLWISCHAAVEGCQNVPIPYLDLAILGMKNISRVLLLHYRFLAYYR